MSAWLPCFACIIWSISILHPSILKEMEVKERIRDQKDTFHFYFLSLSAFLWSMREYSNT